MKTFTAKSPEHYWGPSADRAIEGRASALQAIQILVLFVLTAEALRGTRAATGFAASMMHQRSAS